MRMTLGLPSQTIYLWFGWHQPRRHDLGTDRRTGQLARAAFSFLGSVLSVVVQVWCEAAVGIEPIVSAVKVRDSAIEPRRHIGYIAPMNFFAPRHPRPRPA